MNAFCASENFDAFIASAPLPAGKLQRNTPILNGPVSGDQIRANAAVIQEPLGAEFDPHASHVATILVGRAFIYVLEASPATDIIDYYGFEVGTPTLHIGQHLLKARATALAE